MSAFGQFTTQLCNEEYLVEALRNMGFNPEVHVEPQNLHGYRGDVRADKAHIIIRRDQLSSASNDLGFVRGADGRYTAIISDYDTGAGFGEAWMKQLNQNYCACKTTAVAMQKGYRLLGREEVKTEQGTRIRLQFTTA